MKRSELTRRGFVKGGMVAAGTLMLGGSSVLFGCSSQARTLEKGSEATSHTTESINASDVVIDQGGFIPIEGTMTGADDSPMVTTEYQFVFAVTNNTKGYVGKNITFNVVGLDGDGNPAFSTGVTCPYLYPELRTMVTGSASTRVLGESDQVIATVSELYIEPIMEGAEWLETSLTKSDLESMFSISNVETDQTDESITVTATVLGNLEYANRVYQSTDFDDTLEAQAIAVFSDEEGGLLFGSQPVSLLIDQQTIDTVEGDPSYRNVTIVMPFASKFSEMNLYVQPGM